MNHLKAALMLLFASSLAWAGGMKLDGGEVQFTSIKNGTAPVSGVLQVSGHIHGSDFEVTVDLDTVNTKDPARDLNLKTWLFRVKEHPTMTLKGAIEGTVPTQPGQVSEAVFAAEVHYAGATAPLKLPMILVGTDGGAVQASTKHTVYIDLGSLGLLGEPLNMLIKVCQHESVSPAVALSFSGVFK